MSRKTSDAETHYFEDTAANLIEAGECIARALPFTRDPNAIEQLAELARLIRVMRDRLRELRRWQLDGVEPEYINGHTDNETLARQLETLAAKLRYMD